ncbi:hypothetical protein WAI453_011287 [Rhynchosporium graminicola]
MHYPRLSSANYEEHLEVQRSLLRLRIETSTTRLQVIFTELLQILKLHSEIYSAAGASKIRQCAKHIASTIAAITTLTLWQIVYTTTIKLALLMSFAAFGFDSNRTFWRWKLLPLSWGAGGTASSKQLESGCFTWR